MSTFVSIGNGTQPFTRLLNAVSNILPILPQPVFVQHGATSFSAQACTHQPFVTMGEFEARVRDAQLLIIHAGAGSVIHAIRAGKVPVVMPRLKAHNEIVDDHQLEFVEELERTGKIVAAREPQDLPQAIQLALDLQRKAQAHHQAHELPPITQMVAQLLAETAREAK